MNGMKNIWWYFYLYWKLFILCSTVITFQPNLFYFWNRIKLCSRWAVHTYGNKISILVIRSHRVIKFSFKCPFLQVNAFWIKNFVFVLTKNSKNIIKLLKIQIFPEKKKKLWFVNYFILNFFNFKKARIQPYHYSFILWTFNIMNKKPTLHFNYNTVTCSLSPSFIKK